MIEILGYQFFQNALLMAVLASVASGIIGTYIVVKRMSLITGSMSHTAFGGLGISYFMGSNPIIGALIFSLMSAFGVSLLRRRSKRLDIMLSFSWATGMAIGLLFMFITPGYSVDLFSYLFGNILLVSISDIMLIAVLDVVVFVTTLVMFNSFMSVTFDEEFSEVRNMPVSFIYTVLMSLIALTIVMLIQAVGIVLLIALLTMPAATAQVFRTVKKMMLAASIITLVSMTAGLFVSYLTNLPAGPVIVLLASAFYIASVVLGRTKRNRFKIPRE